MTTASRPTYVPAHGGTGKGETDLSALSKQYSSQDLPGHTKLKYRQDGQGRAEELKGRNFRKELDDREKAAKEKRGSGPSAAVDRERDAGPSAVKKSRIEPVTAANLDADDPLDEEDEDDAGNSDDDDDASELLAELTRIRKERAQELTQKEVERKAEEERIRTENILRGNPLINAEKGAGEFKVVRRWDDDVVFKNCARGEEDKKKAEFVNDTLRSEFHRKFMTKYIK